jgi:hypothetical protein
MAKKRVREGKRLKAGTLVQWTKEFTSKLYRHSRGHRREFIGQVGVVTGLVDFGTQLGPEVNVVFTRSNLFPGKCRLRYAYHPNDLEVL